MRLPTFWGGIHPPQNKDLTVNEEIESYLPKGELVFPMAQNLGAPCSPVVAKGERVLVGTLRADPFKRLRNGKGCHDEDDDAGDARKLRGCGKRRPL